METVPERWKSNKSIDCLLGFLKMERMKLFRRFLGHALPVVLLALFAFGCETPYNSGYSDDSSSAMTGGSSDSMRGEFDPHFRVGEKVTVSFSGVFPLIPDHEEEIKQDGTITPFLVGSVKAVGKTPGELQKELQDLYVPKYYLRLNVTVNPKERTYSVGGYVKQPGPKVWFPQTTVVTAIQAAGDFNEFAKQTNVRVTRGKTSFTVNVKKALKDPRFDKAVFPGDHIHVEKSIW
jgi:protein involved in polysaccharide export with SLBB domain